MEEIVITLEEETNEEMINLLEEEKNEVLISLEQQESTDIVNLNYENMKNLPKVNGNTLIKDKTFADLGAISLTNTEIEKLINNIVL